MKIIHKKTLHKFAATEIFFVTLLWLIILLVAGTLAQKTMGLHLAEQMYFSSYILWVGDIIPLPGGYTTMFIIFVNLTARMFAYSWHIKNLGTVILHLGVMLLLLGGFVTAFFSHEGNMVILEGSSVNYLDDYYEVELSLQNMETGEEVLFDKSQLKRGSILSHSELPFTLTVDKFCENCGLTKRVDQPEDTHGFYKIFSYSDEPLEKEHEANRPGIAVTLSNAPTENEDINGRYAVFRFMPINQTIQLDDRAYLMSLRPVRTAVPFTVGLVDFEKDVHPGTSMARSYTSRIYVEDNGVKWRSEISMNQPLRYKGYTLFQSSFSVREDGAETVLAVVHNKGRLFPYISSIIMSIGLLVHLFQRLPSLMRNRRRKN